MNLYILRHGLAGEAKSHDAAADRFRRLTPKGIKKIEQVSKAIRSFDLHFDAILSSPYLRAKETAEIVVKTLECPQRLKLSAHLTRDASLLTLVQEIKDLKVKNVLVVGHEPGLSALMSHLLFGKNSSAFNLKKGGMAKLAISRLRFGQCATLEWLLTPAQLKLLSRS